MEESVRDGMLQGEMGLLEQINTCFACGKQDVRTYSPLALAYIGEGIFDLVIRTVIVERANRPARDLHRLVIRYVNAPAQARMLEVLEPKLLPQEQDVCRRGRNAKSHNSAKNASLEDYHKATGLEALMGWLYLTGQTQRLLELVKTGIELVGMEI